MDMTWWELWDIPNESNLSNAENAILRVTRRLLILTLALKGLEVILNENEE